MRVEINIPMSDKVKYDLPWVYQVHDTNQFYREYSIEDDDHDEELLQRLAADVLFPEGVLSTKRGYVLSKTYGKNPKIVIYKK